MNEIIRTWEPFIVGGVSLIVQLLYLSYKFGRIEEKLISHDQRIGRLERFNDHEYSTAGGGTHER